MFIFLVPITLDIQFLLFQVNLYYSGCVICELRDFRRSAISSAIVSYVLLKPTAEVSYFSAKQNPRQYSLLHTVSCLSLQTLQCDLDTLTNDGHLWTEEDRNTLESELLLATAEPLCLDPSPSVFYTQARMQLERRPFATPAVKKYIS